MAKWKRHSQNNDVWYVAKIETEEITVYLTPSYSKTGWDIVILYFDEQVGWMYFDNDKSGDIFTTAEKMVADFMEEERIKFCEDKKNKQAWINMIQMLPTSYNQMRTVTLNYENLINMYYARKTHKLHEWHDLCDWIMTLPYAEQLIAVKGNDEH